jgi:hypothetical protein
MSIPNFHFFVIYNFFEPEAFTEQCGQNRYERDAVDLKWLGLTDE